MAVWKILSKALVGFVLCAASLADARPQNDVREVQQYLASLGIKDYNLHVEPDDKSPGNVYQQQNTQTRAIENNFNNIYTVPQTAQNAQNYNSENQEVQRYLASLGIEDYKIEPFEKNTGNNHRMNTETRATDTELNNILKSFNKEQIGQFDNTQTEGNLKQVNRVFYPSVQNSQQGIDTYEIVFETSPAKLPQADIPISLEKQFPLSQINQTAPQELTSPSPVPSQLPTDQPTTPEPTSPTPNVNSESSSPPRDHWHPKPPPDDPWYRYNSESDDRRWHGDGPPHGPPHYGPPRHGHRPHGPPDHRYPHYGPPHRGPPHHGPPHNHPDWDRRPPPPRHYDEYERRPSDHERNYEDRSGLYDSYDRRRPSNDPKYDQNESHEEKGKLAAKKDPTQTYPKTGSKLLGNASEGNKRTQSKNGIENVPLTLTDDSSDVYNDGRSGLNNQFQFSAVTPEE